MYEAYISKNASFKDYKLFDEQDDDATIAQGEAGINKVLYMAAGGWALSGGLIMPRVMEYAVAVIGGNVAMNWTTGNGTTTTS